MPVRLLKSVLKNLNPSNEEELELLKDVLACAQFVQQQSSLDFGIGEMNQLATAQVTSPTGVGHIQELLSAIPESISRYFYGLVEALEVYHSIHGRGLPVARVQLSDPDLRELRKIREMCLEDIPHTGY